MSNLFNKHKDPIREESEVAYADMLKKKSEADSKYGWNRLMQLINADLKTKVWKQQHLLLVHYTWDSWAASKPSSQAKGFSGW